MAQSELFSKNRCSPLLETRGLAVSLFEAYNPSPVVLAPLHIAFTVFGTPTPQGSMKAFFKSGMKRPIVTADNAKTKPWKQQISATALALSVKCQPREIAIAMTLDFYFTKPASVSKRRAYPTVKPDVDKLVRAILDALTGVLYADDAQVVRFDGIGKHYGAPDRCEIQVRVL